MWFREDGKICCEGMEGKVVKFLFLDAEARLNTVNGEVLRDMEIMKYQSNFLNEINGYRQNY